jgi:hypothetical protein
LIYITLLEKCLGEDGFYSGVDMPVFLLDLYAKGEKIDLTQGEKNTLRTILRHIADAYRRQL